MRLKHLVGAALVSIGMSARLLAQDCGVGCQECTPSCECNQDGCESCCDAGCQSNQACCDSNQGCGNGNQECGNGGQDNSDPYTYYQLREAWRQEFKKANGPVAKGVRSAHSKLQQHCAKKHHCNGNNAAFVRASQTPWHGDYYYPAWGAPLPLVVPPTAEFQTNYSWGVPAMRISPIDAQFSRNYPGYGPGVVGGNGFLPPPQQPSDTNQFGVYYVRGTW